MNHLLSWIIWLPVIGIVAVVIIPRDKGTLIKQVSAVVTGVQLVLTIYLWRIYDGSNGTFQFMESAEWIPSFNISYMLGVDIVFDPVVSLRRRAGFANYASDTNGFSNGFAWIFGCVCQLEY